MIASSSVRAARDMKPPEPLSSYCIKITRIVDLLCALRATLTSNLNDDGIRPRVVAGTLIAAADVRFSGLRWGNRPAACG
jgi:hypothetical protein